MPEDIKVPGLGEVPKKYAIGAVIAAAGLGIIVYIRSRNAAKQAASTANSTSATGGTVTDPAGNTCSALDPGSGYCPGTPEDQAYYSDQYSSLGSSDYSGYGADSYGGASFGAGVDAAGYPLGSQADLTWQAQQTTGIESNNQWLQEAISGAVPGDSSTIQAALAAVLGGLTVTTAQQQLFLEAVGILGPPPQGYPPIHTSDTAATSTGNQTGTTGTGTGSGTGGTVSVPNVVGGTAGAAHNAIVAAGLVPVDDNWSSGDASRKVTGQSPAAGTQVASGSTVGYTVSSANSGTSGTVKVPNTVGGTSGNAHNVIVAAGLVPVDGDWKSGDANTKVTRQSPGAGTSVSKNTKVTYYH